jgi:hypothetical protein
MSNFTCQPIVTTIAFFTNMSTQAQRRSDTRASMCALQLNSVRVGLSVPVLHLIRVYWFMLTDLTEGLQVTVASWTIMHGISLDSYRDQSTKLRSRPALTNWRPWGSIRWVANQIEVSVGQQQSVWTWEWCFVSTQLTCIHAQHNGIHAYTLTSTQDWVQTSDLRVVIFRSGSMQIQSKNSGSDGELNLHRSHTLLSVACIDQVRRATVLLIRWLKFSDDFGRSDLCCCPF